MIHCNNYPIKFCTIGPLCSREWGTANDWRGRTNEREGWIPQTTIITCCHQVDLPKNKLGNVCCTGNHVTWPPSHGMRRGEEEVVPVKREQMNRLHVPQSLKKLTATPLVKHSPSFMEHERSSPCSQQPATAYCVRWIQSASWHPVSLKMNFILHFLLGTFLQSGPSPLGFSD